MDFNEKSEKPVFIYKPHPEVEGAFQIFGFFDDLQDYDHVGEYVPVDEDISSELTEKITENLIALLNDREEQMFNFGNLTNGRLLFNIVDNKKDDPDDNKYFKIMFRTFDGKGVSEENAVFKIEKGVFYERFIRKSE